MHTHIPAPKGVIKAWTVGVDVDEKAITQLQNIAGLPFIHRHIAVMPDVHLGLGATVGSVIPTHKAIIPAAVGVDIGCGMMAVKTSLTASDLPESLRALRSAIEAAVPHGRTHHGGKGDRGAWGEVPEPLARAWTEGLAAGYARIVEKHPKIGRGNDVNHLGTLGTGNHFIELCLDEQQHLWVMLHSGSRGVGNRIGTYFIEKAKEELARYYVQLPDKDLAWLAEGTPSFADYVEAVGWAQGYARQNREAMMAAVLSVMRALLPPFESGLTAVNCHHNYVQREHHYGANVWVTRKGAVSAKEGELGIIPGSMGARSYIVRGKGNAESFCSCSHGAGRLMSRTEAKRRFTLKDQVAATEGVECRKDADVIDEIPMAYKPIEAVMKAQEDLVEIVATLKQILCVKG